jgi:hypothetical protein
MLDFSITEIVTRQAYFLQIAPAGPFFGVLALKRAGTLAEYLTFGDKSIILLA